MLLSDILAQLLQGGAGIAPPPSMAMLPKAQNNATGASIPRAATPPLSSPGDFLNAMTQSSMAPSEIMLRKAQAQLAGLQGQLAIGKLGLIKDAMQPLPPMYANGGDQGTAMPGATAPALGGVNPAIGAPGVAATPGNWETAHNNFAGMRIPGVVAGPNSGGFQAFATPEDGIAAISHQLDRYASGATTGKPLTTLNDIVSTWAPPSENPTNTLIARASKVMGVAPDQPLNLGDPGTKAKLVEAMIRNEQGGKLPVDPATIARVVSNPNASALTVGGALAPAQPMMPGLPGAPNQLAAPGAPTMPAMPAAPAGGALGGLNPAYVAAAQQRARMLSALGMPIPPDIAAAATLPFVGPKAGAEAAGKLPYVGPTAAAEAAGKLPYTPLNVRQGGAVGFATPGGGFNLAFQNPKLPEGYTLQPGANGRDMAAPVPGALQGIQATSTAQAAGPAAFKPLEIPGPYGRENLTTALNFASGLGGGNGQTMPRALGNGVATGLPTLAKAASPEAATPTFPVQTPSGTKDLSAIGIDDMFPGGQGIPQPPAPPPGMSYGAPSETEKGAQKDDATRLEEYQKQASGNQKIYQDLLHLRDVMQTGLTTGKLAPLWADLGNVAQSLGIQRPPIPGNPNDAAVFSKASTDLVFAAVKKLAGQVKVAEIEGYKQANPNLTLPPAANMNIINDVLANGKWEDARARLGQEYVTRTGGAPLAAFDAKFNQMAPLVDVTSAYKNAFRQAGAKFPEDTRGAAPAGNHPAGIESTRTIGGKTYFKIGGTWYSP